jgi:hypothetical protein
LNSFRSRRDIKHIGDKLCCERPAAHPPAQICINA